LETGFLSACPLLWAKGGDLASAASGSSDTALHLSTPERREKIPLAVIAESLLTLIWGMVFLSSSS